VLGAGGGKIVFEQMLILVYVLVVNVNLSINTTLGHSPFAGKWSQTIVNRRDSFVFASSRKK
jgi:hypothetical protein